MGDKGDGEEPREEERERMGRRRRWSRSVVAAERNASAAADVGRRKRGMVGSSSGVWGLMSAEPRSGFAGGGWRGICLFVESIEARLLLRRLLLRPLL